MRTFGEIVGKDGVHRLRLLYLYTRRGKGWNFHSLVWQRRHGREWQQRAVISRDAFESGTDRHRWISELHSFDPHTGRAVIKVAEGDQPKTARDIHYIYSWREWDIAADSEVCFIKVCADPFEAFKGHESFDS
jgi:hypothetical protein